MSIFVGYIGAKACTDGPQPGVVNFEHAALKAVPESHSDGIYNCRDVRGSTTTTSLHGEGRAFDWGCKAGAPWAAAAANLLVRESAQLGIQCVIYNRRIWSGAHPRDGWRSYSGVDAHTTHLHIEFSWAAARDLTQARAAHYLAPLEDDMPLSDDDLDKIAHRVWAYQNKRIEKYDVYRISRETRNAAKASARDAAGALAIAKAQAAAGRPLTADEITAAAKAGAKAAIDEEITGATVELNVTKGAQ